MNAHGQIAQEFLLRLLFWGTVVLWGVLPAEVRAAEDLSGWERGIPDIIISSASPYTFPPSPQEQRRSFVIPSGLSTTHHVRAIEVKPGNPAADASHVVWSFDPHAIDYRMNDELSASFDGLVADQFRPLGIPLPVVPSGNLSESIEAAWAWPLSANRRLVCEIVVRPHTDPVIVRPQIGLFTTKRPHHPPTIVWIEADQANSGLTSFTLPRAVQLLAAAPRKRAGRCLLQAARSADASSWSDVADFTPSDDRHVTQFESPQLLPAGAKLRVRETSGDQPCGAVALWLLGGDAADTTIVDLAWRKAEWQVRADAIAARIDRSADDPKSLFLSGLVARQGNQLSQAAQTWVRLVELAPDHAHAHFQLALLYRASRQIEKSVDHLAKALDVVPDFTAAHLELGNLYLASRDLEQAAKHLHTAAQRQPRLVTAKLNLAALMAMTGDIEGAVDVYRDVISIDPWREQAYRGLAQSLASRNKVAEAVVELESGLQQLPSSLQLQLTHGRYLQQQGRNADAAESFRRTLGMHPESIDAMNALAWLLATSPEKTEQQVEESLYWSSYAAEVTQYQDPRVLLTLAEGFAAQSDYTKAIETVDRALQVVPQVANHELLRQTLETRRAIYRSRRDATSSTE